MPELTECHKVVIEKFQELLRSGKDYTVKSMCEEAAKATYMHYTTASDIVKKYYRELINQEMIDCVNNSVDRCELIKDFSERFDVCTRESILLIRYVKVRNNG